jgi:hypothetical protein
MGYSPPDGGAEYELKLTEEVFQLVSKLSDKKWLKQQVFQSIAGPLSQTVHGNDGEFVLSKNWDNLVILDGCRYDVFNDHINELSLPEGDLEIHRSRGSGSLEFVQENFEGRDLSDIVLATANPFYQVVDNLKFHDVDHLWATHWDEEQETVLAKDVTSAAIDLHQKYPHKRLIVHYMQPHYPFLGDRSVDTSGFGGVRSDLLGEDTETVTDVWSRLEANDVTVEEVWNAYVDNLRYVAPFLSELLMNINGTSVITADHGNAFGERAFGLQVFGHPVNLRLDALVEVPWYTVKNGSREIRAGGQKEIDTDDSGQIKERLQALGYR